MRFRQLYLLVLIGLTAAVILSASAGNVGRFKWEWELNVGTPSVNMGTGFGQYPNAQSSASVSRVAEGLSTFLLSNPIGSVRVRGVDGDQIQIAYTISVLADTQERAQEYLDSCSVSSEALGDRLSVRLIQLLPTTPDIRGVAVDYDVLVPHGLKLDISNSFGEVDVSDYNGDVTIDNQFSPTTVSNIVGDVLVDARHGRFSITGITGDVAIRSSFADSVSDLADVSGTTMLQLQHCDDVELRNVADSVVVSSEFSRLRLASVDGPTEIDSQHSTITGSSVEGSIAITSEFDTIRLSRVVNRVSLKARHGDIHIGLMDGHEAASGFSIDIRATYGSIKSSIPLREDETSPTETWASGTHGSGSTPIVVRTEHTDVQLTLDN